jgi:hypothetical protein
MLMPKHVILYLQNGYKMIFERNIACAVQTKDPSYFLKNASENYFDILIPDVLHLKELI